MRLLVPGLLLATFLSPSSTSTQPIPCSHHDATGRATMGRMVDEGTARSPVRALASHVDGGSAAQPLPLVFEPNRGQFPEDVRYVARANDLVVTLLDDHARRLAARGRVRPQW